MDTQIENEDQCEDNTIKTMKKINSDVVFVSVGKMPPIGSIFLEETSNDSNVWLSRSFFLEEA